MIYTDRKTTVQFTSGTETVRRKDADKLTREGGPRTPPLPRAPRYPNPALSIRYIVICTFLEVGNYFDERWRCEVLQFCCVSLTETVL